MIIYTALIVPLIATIVLFVFFKYKTAWWEFPLPMVATLFFIFLFKALVVNMQVSSTEYWGSLITRVEYYEEWDEWISATCYTQCCCDAQGNNCQQMPYDCSYRAYHAPQYIIYTTTNETVYTDRNNYEKIKHAFNNSRFVELNRSYYQIDGNAYVTEWPKDSISAVPVTTEHTYENRVKAADHSVFHFGKVTEKDVAQYGLKSYPEIFEQFKMNSIIGDTSNDCTIAEKKFQYMNGLLGPKKQVRVFVLVFKNKPIEAGIYQQWYWQGANMNEMVIAIGIDNSRNVKWCNPISWTTNEELKVMLKNYVMQQKELNLQAIAEYSQQEIDKGFVRKNFKEFDYLTVEPSNGAILACFIITIAICAGFGFWIITNEYDN